MEGNQNTQLISESDIINVTNLKGPQEKVLPV